MTGSDEFLNLIKERNIITTAEVLAKGISKADFYKYIKASQYEKIAHGVYAHKDTFADPAYLLHLRCPEGVFSHDEALFYHGLIDREPMQQTITIYSGYNTKRLTESGIKVFTVKKELLTTGRTTVKDFYGYKIPMYDLERTICDLVRNRSGFEIQDFQTALKTYITRKDKNLNLLVRYAKLFRIEKVLRTYMEVLL